MANNQAWSNSSKNKTALTAFSSKQNENNNTTDNLLIVLTSRVESLQLELDSNLHGKRKQAYTTDPWRLQFKGQSIEFSGIPWYWCTKPHWSNRKMYNGMYCRHKTEDHDKWRRAIDSKKDKSRKGLTFGPVITVIKGPRESIWILNKKII